MNFPLALLEMPAILERMLEKTLRWIVIGGLFAIPFIPLIVAHNLFFPFITGKNFTFRILVEICIGAWLALALVYPAYRPKRSWLLGVFALFVLIIGLADLLGANPGKSFWSNYERMEGWVTLVHLLGYVTILTVFLNTTKLWSWFWHTSIGVSVIMGLYAVLQLVGFITINQGGVRVDGTLGNATYLGVYMLFHLFITALMWEYTVRKNATRRIAYGFLYGSIMMLNIVVLFFTATRGAILGVIGGALLAMFLLMVFARSSPTLRRISAGMIGALLILVGVFILIKDTQFVQGIEPMRRLASISLTETTVASRFLNWNMAWQGVKERPLLGWGQENYNLVFNKYYDPRMYAQEPWFDRVHNIVFDWLVAGGVLGFLSYASLFAVALWLLWRAGDFTVYEKSILTGMLAGYLFHNLFVFDNITSYILFASTLAYISARASIGRDESLFRNGALPQQALPVIVGVVVIVTWGAAWVTNASALGANRTLIQALSPQADLTKNLELFKQALSYESYGTQEIREQLIQGVGRIAPDPNIPLELKSQFAQFTVSEMQKQVESTPNDARFPLFLGVVLNAYGQYADAERYLQKAKELSPKKQSILFELASNALAQERFDEAEAYTRAALDLEPSFQEARVLYATVLVIKGDFTKATEVMASLIKEGTTPDQRLVNAYAEKKQYRTIATMWESRVAKHPEDGQAWFALAASYHAAGDVRASIATLERAAAAHTELAAQANMFIEQIKNGTLPTPR